MPCYAIRTVTQVIENVPDISLLAAALKEMGLAVRLLGQTIAFSGVDKTGTYQQGSYEGGKLKTQQGMDLALLKKYTAVANLKKQVKANNADKYKQTKITLKKVGEFHYKVIKK